jgi:choline dehydrogenase-like flavoprotein
LKGERLYRAHGQPGTGSGVLSRAQAIREVILCGGAFNTPQLLMLSGIGPRAVLEPLGVPMRVDLPGWAKTSRTATRSVSSIAWISHTGRC